LKILIADDEALSRRLLEKTLERAGYEVVAVENGRLAVEQLSRPDGPRLALCEANKICKSRHMCTWFC
jgi:two-component system cell cycle response regulator